MDKSEFEKIRLEAVEQLKKRNRILLFGSLGIILASFLGSTVMFGGSYRARLFGPFSIIFALSIALFFIVLLLIILTVFHPSRTALAAYRDAYKTYFVQESLAEVFDNLKYDRNSGLPRLVVQEVMTAGDRYHSNDLITAKYKDINFTQADVHTEREHRSTDSNGHTTTTYTTIFKGRFLIFDFNRDFKFRLELVGKNFAGARLVRSNKAKFGKIETESPEFSKHFTIYAQDGFEAFYILDPSFIEKLQALGEYYDDHILFGFIDKRLYVAVGDNNDSFEPPHPDKLTDEKAEINRVKSDIATIIQFVDKLTLNRYMFGGKA